MHVYNAFLRVLLRNYIIGSLAAVFGIGGTYIFSTIHVVMEDLWFVLGTLIVSVLVMFLFEALVFRKHLRPVARLFNTTGPTLELMEAAYLQVHRFPFLTVRRTLGPHLFGFMIPGMVAAFFEIRAGLIHLPLYYIVLAVLGCVLVAGMHATLEFYLTGEAVKPMLAHLRKQALEAFSVDLSLGGHVLVTTRRKFTLSTLLVGVFPLLLFSLATQVQLAQQANAEIGTYWKWAGIILVLGIAFASASALLMSRAVQQPIQELTDLMRDLQKGKFHVYAEDSYSDEFSKLVAGFNHMVRGLSIRDELNNKLVASYFTTLAAALDARDPYTAGHSIRVAHFSVQIGKLCGMTQEEVDTLNKSALLHDIGKIGIRDDVLLKDGKLTDEEFAQIKLHPVLGEAILKQIQPAETMAPLLPGVRSHHERYDGRGYPDGLKGLDIPLLGRIIAVADAFDAMTSDRPYRKGMPVEKALAILHDGKGTQWDPVFAQLFIDWVRGQEGDLELKKADLKQIV